VAPTTGGEERRWQGRRWRGRRNQCCLIEHTSSSGVGGETEGAQGPLGSKRP